MNPISDKSFLPQIILCSLQLARWQSSLQYDAFIHALQLFIPKPVEFCRLHKFDISIFNTCFLTKRFQRVASYLGSTKSTVPCNRWEICWYSTMFYWYWCQTRNAWEWSEVLYSLKGRVFKAACIEGRVQFQVPFPVRRFRVRSVNYFLKKACIPDKNGKF